MWCASHSSARGLPAAGLATKSSLKPHLARQTPPHRTDTQPRCAPSWPAPAMASGDVRSSVLDALNTLVGEELKARVRLEGARMGGVARGVGLTHLLRAAVRCRATFRVVDARAATTTTVPSSPCQSVSYKWLAREYDIPVTLAKQLLCEFVERCGGRAAATYLVAGWAAPPTGGPRTHVVRVVPGDALAAARAALDPLTAVHVFSVAPCQPKDALDVFNQDADQAGCLFAALLVGEANCLTDNRWSAIACTDVVAAPPRTGAAKAEANASPTAAPPAAPKAPAAAPAAPKAGTIAAKIKAAAAVKPAAAKKKAAPAGNDFSPQPAARKAATKARVMHSSSDEEEEDVAATAGYVSGGGAPSPPPMEAPSPSPAPGGAKRGSAKPGAVAGVKKRKITRSIINAAGEEVTETVVVEDEEVVEVEGGNDGGGGVPAPGPAPPTAPRASPPPKKAVPKSKPAAKGQRNITAFFRK